jgi:hypothetical protein
MTGEPRGSCSAAPRTTTCCGPGPATGTWLRLVARVTLTFFDRYVLGRASGLATMTREGNVSGTAALVSGGQLPP